MNEFNVEVKKETFVTDQINRLIESTELPIKKENLINLFNKKSLMIHSVHVNDENVGMIISRIDYNFNGNNELVIMFSIAEKDIERPLHHVLCLAYETMSNGMDIRIHSDRKAIDEYLIDNGFDFLESVYIKKANNVN